MFTLILAGIAASGLHASTVTMQFTSPGVGQTSITGFGSFSYNGPLASIGLANITAFSFEEDFTNSGQIPQTYIVQFGLSDLQSLSATVSGGVVTALSLVTGYEAAINTSNFDENQKNLVVNSLATNGSYVGNEDELFNRHTIIVNGTITTQGPGAATPEPSTALLASGAALLLAFLRRTSHAPRG
jgi:hypothetical protein